MPSARRSDAGSRAGPTLSAVICTRDRPERLARAIRSLEEQSAPPDEILVIDNSPEPCGSRKAGLDAVSPAAVGEPGSRGQAAAPARPGIERAAPCRVRYRIEPIPGLDFARNRALDTASGEVVAFLDDDAVAHVDWVRETRIAFHENPGLVACMGRVDALSFGTPGARLFEANGGFARGSDPIRLPGDARGTPLIARVVGVGSGCSMALRRRRALELGGFDEALDMGRPLPGGGDLDMLWRILEAGGEVLYQPRVRALHEHRPESEAAIAQIADHNRALTAMLVKTLQGASGPYRLPIAAFLGWRLVKPGVRMIRGMAGRDPLPLRALAHLWRSCWLGLGAYAAARGEARRRRESAEKRRAADEAVTPAGGSSG